MIHNHIDNSDTNELTSRVREYFNKYQKLPTYDWLSDISHHTGIIEISFKNTRKGFYTNPYKIPLEKGDIVAVEANTGHDIGVVSLTSELAEKQFNRKIKNKQRYHFYKIWRKATTADMENFLEAKKREKSIRNHARMMTKEYGLDMKISDVELQGDNTKAIFYFLAEGRVDFRDLIKAFAREFRLKIEMKQIGARQEAAMIGGLELSGREFCGSTWKTEFESVKSSAAKIQQLSLNDPKLIDHSGHLKNCLLYELDVYKEAWNEFPKHIPPLELNEGTYYPHKIDVLKREVWFSISEHSMMNPIAMPISKVKEIMEENRNNRKGTLEIDGSVKALDSSENDFSVGTADIMKKKKMSRKKSKNRKKSRSNSKRKNIYS